MSEKKKKGPEAVVREIKETLILIKVAVLIYFYLLQTIDLCHTELIRLGIR